MTTIIDNLNTSLLRGVFHVHASVLGETITVDLIPNEGLDLQNVQSITLMNEPRNASAPVQVELLLMESGFVSTWLWGWCSCKPNNGCYVGQFAPQGSHKAVKDSGAYRFA